MEKARAKEHAKNVAFSKKGATQILTKASSTIAALQAMIGRSDIDLIAPPLVVLRQRQNQCIHGCCALCYSTPLAGDFVASFRLRLGRSPHWQRQRMCMDSDVGALLQG